jgi:fibronectin type 3 domain-containing protein
MKSTHPSSLFYVLSLFAIIALSAGAPCRASSPPVPPSYQALYNTLNSDLDAFNTSLGTVTPYPVISAGPLVNASGDTGPQLTNETNGVELQILALKALGVQAVMIQVGFPILDPNFYTFLQTQPGFEQITYTQLENFYQTVAQNVRAAGLKLIVENNVLLANDVQAGWAPATTNYYATLDWPTFESERAQCALNIAEVMQPDYFVVLESPDTEAIQVGQSNLATTSGATDYLSQVLSVLEPVRSSMMIGAGVESYLVASPGFAAFISSFLSLPAPGLDFIDMQVYPVNNLGPGEDFLQNALTIASMAQAAGKPVSMTEAWMWKLRDSEWNTINYDAMRARNVFSFWAPLDSYFIQTMENLSNYTQMLFMSPSGGDYLFAYQTYNKTTATWPPGKLLSTEITLETKANQVGGFTTTGMNYYNSLVAPPDIIPPTTPTLLTANSGSSTSAAMSWTASTDNIGVASYHLWRDGTPLPNTTMTVFTDTGLSNYTTYNYQIEAVDLAGNTSAPLLFSITTQNSVPPDAPVLTGVPVTTQEVTLTWTPAVCPAPISSYLLFQGNSPDTLQQVQQAKGSVLTANIFHLTPGATYYFGIEAASSGLISPMSAVISVTTLGPPTAPTNVTATAPSPTQVQVSWSPSTGGVAIAWYHVYRGDTPSTVTLTVCTTQNTSCGDYSVSPQTTYYYGVEASDTNNNYSPMSAIVSVITPGGPSAPTNFTGVAQSGQEISLSWSPADSVLPVTSYLLFRGDSPGTLVQIQQLSSSSLSFNNYYLTPSTPYYYGIEAKAQNYVSPMSMVIEVNTMSAPTAPDNLLLTAIRSSEVQVSWLPSTGDLPIAWYHVYRGTSPSSVTQQVCVTQNTTCNDYSTAGQTEYYYDAQAVDTGNDPSPLSEVVSVTTP